MCVCVCLCVCEITVGFKLWPGHLQPSTLFIGPKEVSFIMLNVLIFTLWDSFPESDEINQFVGINNCTKSNLITDNLMSKYFILKHLPRCKY